LAIINNFIMKKKIILVVCGGTSSEREISLKSGKACSKAIKKLKYKVLNFDPAKDDFKKIKNYDVDLIFNALHGKDGEDGIAQSYFEYFKIPYTHSGILSSMNSMDKIVSKKIFKKSKIRTPAYIELNTINYLNTLKEKNILKSGLTYPLVLKPSDEGSSIGVKICKNFTELRKNVTDLIKRYKTLIVENFIGGQEIQVAVINGKSLGAIELKPKRKFYDYKAKYFKSAQTQHLMPANLSNKKYKEVLDIAKKAHNALKCRGLTRSDFKFEDNKFYLLEINTQPGMTDLSLVPEIAKHVNISFQKLVKNIIDDASNNR
jgi:D-alanine-D-alanine ligase|tara:strand:- start:240 stop:1193 length:954 start_codon:yes stop_codon:yes gene_type:complete